MRMDRTLGRCELGPYIHGVDKRLVLGKHAVLEVEDAGHEAGIDGGATRRESHWLERRTLPSPDSDRGVVIREDADHLDLYVGDVGAEAAGVGVEGLGTSKILGVIDHSRRHEVGDQLESLLLQYLLQIGTHDIGSSLAAHLDSVRWRDNLRPRTVRSKYASCPIDSTRCSVNE